MVRLRRQGGKERRRRHNRKDCGEEESKLCSLQFKEAAVSHQHLGSNQGACFMMLTQCGLKCGSLLEEEEGKGGELGEGWFTSKLGWDVSLGTSQSLVRQMR